MMVYKRLFSLSFIKQGTSNRKYRYNTGLPNLLIWSGVSWFLNFSLIKILLISGADFEDFLLVFSDFQIFFVFSIL